MRIAIVGGKNKADFIISSLIEKDNKIMVINDEEEFCHYLAKKHKIPVYHGDISRSYTLEDAGIEGYDLIIALGVLDSDNLAICQSAKKLLNIKKAVAVVSNPKYVDVFEKLGVDKAISATYLLANYIAEESTGAVLNG